MLLWRLRRGNEGCCLSLVEWWWFCWLDEFGVGGVFFELAIIF